MTLHVVTEGRLEARIIARTLKPSLGDTVRIFFADCGPAAPASMARSFLGDAWPVALVLHTKTRKAEKIQRLRAFYEEVLGAIGSRRNWRVLFFKPRVEGLLFHDADVLRRLTGRAPTQEELKRARTRPRTVLAEMLGVPREELPSVLLPRLEGADLSTLATHPRIRRLLAFHAVLEARPEHP